MPLIDVRELLAFPTNPVNSSDTLIGGVHFNLTILKYWNYTYYSNGTLSNGSWCLLTFDPYTPPVLLANGTFLNSTSCYSPIEPIKARGIIGMVFAVYFALSIVFTFINLRKHGRRFLPAEKRFRPVGRRWQWYWLLAAAACGMISGIGGIDVDRYYLPEFPIVLTNLGYFLILPTTMAAVWEGVRHWGSWQERQLIDPNPFALPQGGKRDRTEFFMPLVFYLFVFLNFFMTVPRSWGGIEEQRSPDQTAAVGEPNATDARFKAGAFLLFLSWLVICFALRHYLHYYKPRSGGTFNSIGGIFRYVPLKFLIIIPLSLVMVGYEAAIAFNYSMSPLNVEGNIAFIYGLGWTPIALIFLVYEVAGYIDPNEDKELIRQRRIRGAQIDEEMGYTKKPHWWSSLHGDVNPSVQETIAKNVREVGGSAAMTRNRERSIEMASLPARRASQRRDDRLSKSAAPEAARPGSSLSGPLDPFSDPFSDTKPRQEPTDRGRSGGTDAASSMTKGGGISERSTSTASGTTLNAPPQQIRSMLDV